MMSSRELVALYRLTDKFLIRNTEARFNIAPTQTVPFIRMDDGGKDPWLIQMPGEMPFAFAGLWAHNSKLDVTSCTIITAPSIAPISQIHDRMPVILDPEVFDGWLSPNTPKENLKGILVHHLDGQMQMHRVSRDINSSRFTGRPAPILNSL